MTQKVVGSVGWMNMKKHGNRFCNRYFYVMELSHNKKELTSYNETYQISSCLVSVVFCSWMVLYTSIKRFVSLVPNFFEKSFEVLIIWEYDQVIESFSVTTVLD